MDIEKILSLPESEWLTELQVDPVVGRDIEKNIEYYGGKHPILTDPSRQDYSIPKWKIDEDGEFEIGSNGRKIPDTPEQVKRTRLVLNYQVQIVDTAVGMCLGEPVTLTLNSADEQGHQDLFHEFVDQWRNETRLDSFNTKLGRSLFKESKAAEILFINPDDKEKDIKATLLSKENGDDFWANFDDNGSMDAFTRVYTKRDIVNGKAEDVEVTQIWTAKFKLEKINDGEWVQVSNPYEKIPVVFYDQKEPEWQISKELITKQELVRSRNSDVNKRVGNPNVVIDGELANMPETEQDVKVWTLKNGTDLDGKPIKSDVRYLTSDSAPEAIKMEVDQDRQDMYKLTWPDLSFLRDSIKTGSLSGTAIKLMFTDSFVKIGNKREIFEDFSRRVSIMKRMMAISRNNKKFEELNISVQFNSILPANLTEITDIWSTAKASGITSTEKAVSSWPLNNNDPDVLDQIESDNSLEAGSA